MVTFDYDSRKRQAIIKSDNLSSIMEHFSFENEGASVKEGTVGIFLLVHML